MKKHSKIVIIYFTVVLLLLFLIYQNMSLQSHINNISSNLSSLQYSTQNELASLRIQLYELEQAARGSYGESASVVGMNNSSRLLDVEVTFSLKEYESGANVSVAANEENGRTVKMEAKYENGFFIAVLPLDAAKTYSIIYESSGTKTATGELLANYQPKDELINRFKLSFLRSDSKDRLNLRPYAVNNFDGNNLLRIKTLRMIVTQQTPEEITEEFDLMPYLDKNDMLPVDIDEYEFPMPEHCDYTVSIIITDNLGYTYTYFETFHRRGRAYSENMSGASNSIGNITIS